MKSKNLKSGTDLTDLIKNSKIKLPKGLSNEKISYVEYSPEFEKSKNKLVILTKPNANIDTVLGIRIGCTTIRGRRVCLECGWLYCKIVIYF